MKHTEGDYSVFMRGEVVVQSGGIPFLEGDDKAEVGGVGGSLGEICDGPKHERP